MPRKPRIEYAGAVYHVMSRGVKGMPIRLAESDCELFVETLGQACERTGWRVHAAVQMVNHTHLLLETPESNLVDGMKWFQGAYAQRFNARHQQRGQVFQGRYKALIIDPESDGYFETVSTYIHLNPVRAGILKDGPVQAYRFSSYPFYLTTPRRRPPWLVVDRVLGNLALSDNRSGRRSYGEYIERQAAAWREEKGRKALTAEWKGIRRGWYLGDGAFRDELLNRMDQVLDIHQRDSYSGPSVVGHDERRAEQLLQLGMGVLGLTEGELATRPKGDIQKCALAWLIHTRTTAQHRWISKRLDMGAPTSMTHYINRIRDASTSDAKRLRRRLERAVQTERAEYED